jgi:hypothetical protein
MKKKKEVFIAEEDDLSQEEYALPSRDLYYVYPSKKRGEGRQQLTERDIKRNKGVDRLFDSVRPGVPIDADPPETRVEALSMSTCMEGVLSKLGVGASPWVQRLTDNWSELVGETAAQVCRPGKWDSERKILYIYVGSASKLFELQRTKTRIFERKIREFAPEYKLAAVRFMQQM